RYYSNLLKWQVKVAVIAEIDPAGLTIVSFYNIGDIIRIYVRHRHTGRRGGVGPKTAHLLYQVTIKLPEVEIAIFLVQIDHALLIIFPADHTRAVLMVDIGHRNALSVVGRATKTEHLSGLSAVYRFERKLSLALIEINYALAAIIADDDIRTIEMIDIG